MYNFFLFLQWKWNFPLKGPVHLFFIMFMVVFLIAFLLLLFHLSLLYLIALLLLLNDLW